jgi:molybdenum cofactor biosynthesis protein B
MSQAVAEHQASAPLHVRCAVLTVSDTRTVATDTSGALILERVEGAGHVAVDRRIVPDEPGRIEALVSDWLAAGNVDCVLITGGTGIAPRDQTFEAISRLLTKTVPGFGELFRMLSYQEIGAAAMLSRAVGGLIDDMLLFAMPGSRAAVDLAMSRLIVPVLPHAVGLTRPKLRRHS